MAQTTSGKPQFPAHPLNRTLVAVRRSIDERLTISGDTPPKPNGLDLSICSYKCRCLTRDEQLNHLLEEERKITCDVLGLCDTRRKKCSEATWKDGTFIKLGRGEDARTVGRIGFVVSKKYSSKIISCEIRSSRIIIFYLNINGKKTLKIVQVYAPTSNSEDEDVEEFCKELEDSFNRKSTYTIVMGDFNAKIGRGKVDENYIGRYGIGKRNERGERLATFAETKKLYIGNSWFQKKAKRRWTWVAHNTRKRNEIDYFLINTR